MSKTDSKGYIGKLPDSVTLDDFQAVKFTDLDIDKFRTATQPITPEYYNKGGVSCIDAMVAAHGKQAVADFCLCNAHKYIWRTREKNGKEDIDKAIWYLNKYKELMFDNTNVWK